MNILCEISIIIKKILENLEIVVVLGNAIKISHIRKLTQSLIQTNVVTRETY